MILELMIALTIGAGLFAVGLYGALSQTNLVMIIMGVELILAAALVNLVAFWRYLHPDEPAGQMFVLIIMAISKSRITCAGEKKCRPITSAGRRVMAAMSSTSR
tara:strand:- start:118 stop:429 length:312 start_codon:yes stop_codon:yes gene_type:complete